MDKTTGFKLTSIAAGVLLATTAMAQDQGDQGQAPSGDGQAYHTLLVPANNSGVIGKATVVQSGDDLTVAIEARGLEDGEHPQHIHGFEDDSEVALPTLEQDENGDNLIQTSEGETVIGPVILPLEPFPQASDGRIAYARTFDLDDLDVTDADGNPISADDLSLDERVIELHGMTVDGSYDADIPVASGILQAIRLPGDDDDGAGDGNGGDDSANDDTGATNGGDDGVDDTDDASPQSVVNPDTPVDDNDDDDADDNGSDWP